MTKKGAEEEIKEKKDFVNIHLQNYEFDPYAIVILSQL